MEVGTPENALKIFNHLKDSGINLFSQKTGWGKVHEPEDMPTSHREGGLFVTSKDAMLWS